MNSQCTYERLNDRKNVQSNKELMNILTYKKTAHKAGFLIFISMLFRAVFDFYTSVIHPKINLEVFRKLQL